jgi:formate--tetrahydrofolate ligase
MDYYDASKLADWKIAQAAEKDMPPLTAWKERLGLQEAVTGLC